MAVMEGSIKLTLTLSHSLVMDGCLVGANPISANRNRVCASSAMIVRASNDSEGQLKAGQKM